MSVPRTTPAPPVSAPPERPIGAVANAFPGAAGLGARDLARPSPPPEASPAADPSPSLPIPARRPWRLVVAVLLIDAALAAAGTWMLSQGLGDRSGTASSGSSPRRSR